MPPAADNANPAESDAPNATPPETETPADASSPNDASTDTPAPAETPADTPIPPPIESSDEKSISAPALNDKVLSRFAATPRHAAGSSPTRAAKSAADSPASAVRVASVAP